MPARIAALFLRACARALVFAWMVGVAFVAASSQTLAEPVGTLRAHSARPGSVALDWQVPPGAGPDSATRYRVHYDTAPLMDALWTASPEAEPVPAEAPEGGLEVTRIDGLVPGQRYYFRVAAEDAAGQLASPSNQVSAYVPEATFFGGYRTTGQLYLDMQMLADAYPELVEIHELGESHAMRSGSVTSPDGREITGQPIWGLRIGNPEVLGDKPAFVIGAGMHAREITVPEATLRFAEALLEGHGVDADRTWLVDHTDIWLVPTLNPDGRWLVELGADVSPNGKPWLWRKTAKFAPGVACQYPPTPLAHAGVDLNRNFDWSWGNGTADQCNEFYGGTSPTSEAEAQALADLLESLFPDKRSADPGAPADRDTSGLFINLHSGTSAVLWPWGATSEAAPDADTFELVGGRMAALAGMPGGQTNSLLYPVHGGANDWLYGELGVVAFTYEMHSNFTPPYSQFDLDIFPRENSHPHLDAFIYGVKAARAPYRVAGAPEVGTPRVHRVGVDEVRVAAVVASDTGIVSGAELFIDTPPWADGVAIAMQAADGVFDSPYEIAEAVLDASLFALQGELVYVRGLRPDGDPGVPSAQFAPADSEPGDNHPPTVLELTPAVDDGQLIEVETGVASRFSVQALDPEGLSLSYTWLVDGAPIVGADGPAFDFVPGVANIGATQLEVVVSDGLYHVYRAFDLDVIDARTEQAVARWALDESAGDLVIESAGLGVNGTAHGAPLRVLGVNNGALQCDELDDRITLPGAASVLRETFTVSFWFRDPDNSGNRFEYLLSTGTVAEPNSLNIYLHEGRNQLRTVFRDSKDASGFDDVIDVTGLADGQWHHYALTVDATAATPVRVFVDGLQRGASAGVGGDPFSPPDALTLCARSDLQAERYYGGDLDELSVYNRALSAAEVVALREGRAPGIDNAAPTLGDPDPAPAVELLVGEAIAFHAVASDNDEDELHYAWYLDGVRRPSAMEDNLTLDSDDFGAGGDSGELTLVASDGIASVSTRWQVTVVEPPNEPPMLTGTSPASPVRIDPAIGATFIVNASDPEGTPLHYEWWLNGARLDGELAATLVLGGADTPASGTLEVRISDDKQTVAHEWRIQRDSPGNDPPEIVSTSPDTPAVFYQLADAIFGAVVNDPENDVLQYRWWVDGVEPAGAPDAPVLTLASLDGLVPADVGEVRVVVSDGEFEVSHEWRLSIDAASIGLAPVAHLRFDEPAGGVVADSAPGAGAPATAFGGPTRVDGVDGSALSCDELDDHVRLAIGEGLGGSAFATAFWFRDAAVEGDFFEYLFSLGNAGSASSLNVYFCEPGSNCGGSLRTYFRDSSDASRQYIDVPGLADGDWHHYALSVDSSSDTPLRLYIDGELVRERTDLGSDPFAPAPELFVCGRSDLNGQRFYGGDIDDLRLYAGALDDIDVAALASGGSGKPVNRAPRIVASDPAPRVIYDDETSIAFSIEAQDGDGDPLTYAWSVDGAPLPDASPAIVVDTAALDPDGSHVEVVVSDGESEATTRWTTRFDSGVYVPVSRFAFDEGAGAVAGDSGVPGASDGVLLGDVDWLPNADGAALACDGVDDQFRADPPGDLDDGVFTVSFEFTDDDVSGNAYEYLLSLGRVAQSNSLNVYFCEDRTGCAGQLRTVYKSATDGSGFDDAIDVPALADGQPHRYTLRVDRSASTPVQVYIDGLLVGESAAAGRGDFRPSGAVHACARQDGNSARFYHGALDDLRFYGEALPEDVIESGTYLDSPP